MLLVAEIGLNHDGNFDLIYELVRQAQAAGADIVKFQFGWRGKPEEMNFFDAERAEIVKSWCDHHEIEMLASIFTDEALELGHHVGLQRYKIASRTVLDDPALCERILAEGKPTYVSLGMWDKADFPFGRPGGNLHYLFCRSKYPTMPWDLRDMPASFGPDTHYGFSDHLQGIEASLLAIARGAKFIERHLTLDKTSQVIRDHTLSSTPDEFRQLNDVGRPLAKLVAIMQGKDR